MRTINFNFLVTDIQNQFKMAKELNKHATELSAIAARLPDCEYRGTVKASISTLHSIADDLVANALRTTFGFGIAVRFLEDNGFKVIGGVY